MTEVLKRTVGTQTSFSIMMTAEIDSAAKNDPCAEESNRGHNNAAEASTVEMSQPTEAKLTSPASTSSSTKSAPANTRVQNKASPPERKEECVTGSPPIFSPKSAAVALSNLFKGQPASPRRCFSYSGHPSANERMPHKEGVNHGAAVAKTADLAQASMPDTKDQQYSHEPTSVGFSAYPPSYQEAPSYWTTNASPEGDTNGQFNGYQWGAHHHHQQQQQMHVSASAYHRGTSNAHSLARLASNNTSLVTPTPKKAKLVDLMPRQTPYTGGSSTHRSVPVQHGPILLPPPQVYPHPPPPAKPLLQAHQQHSRGYSRKTKSLGVLADNFMKKFEACDPGFEVGVDEAAAELGVERRRIYDVVNILESISILVKKGKNTYTWLGKEFLPDKLGELQARALKEGYDKDAAENGLDTSEKAGVVTSVDPVQGSRGSIGSTASDDSKKDTSKSLARLSQQFLQVFLVGHDAMNLPQASDRIQGTLTPAAYAAIGSVDSKEEFSDPSEFRRAAQRGLKTKIRRLYDIANVLASPSLGLLKKVQVGVDSMEQLSSNRRPHFGWAYALSPKELQERYLQIATSVTTAAPSIAPKSVPAKEHQQDRTPATTPSSSMAPPSTGMTTSSWPSSSISSMGPPENVTTAISGNNDTSRGVLDTINQSGGAYPSTPSSNMARTVTLQQPEGAVEHCATDKAL